MIDESDIERAVDFLRDSAGEIAQARADRVYAEEYRKSLKAMLMAEKPDLALGAQERDAYADKRYRDHLVTVQQAVFREQKLMAQRAAATMKIEAWQTMSANLRGIKV